MVQIGGDRNAQHNFDRGGRSSRRKPLALTESGARGVVLVSVNQAARRAGLQPGLSVSDAKAIYPSLLTIPLDRAGNEAALYDLARWLGRYGPNRNIDGDDGLWVEISGVAHLFGGESPLAEDIVERLQDVGLTARVGIADTYGAAFALARYGCDATSRCAVAAHGETEKAVGALPVDALRLDDESLLLLKRLGLRRISQVAALPRSTMARRFRDDARGARRQDREALARAVVWRLDQLVGETGEPKVPLEPPPHRNHRIRFAEPLISSEGITAAVQTAAQALSAELAEVGEGAISVRLSLFRADGTVAAVEVGVSRPSRHPDHLLKLFDIKLPEMDAGLGIDVVLLSALHVAPLDTQQQALGHGAQSAGTQAALADLVDRLSNRLGCGRVAIIARAESHCPERAAVSFAAQQHLQKRTQTRDKPSPGAQDLAGGFERLRADDICRQRPQFLLERPEPIDVLAALPEGPPARFKWRRRQCRVHLASPPERIAPEWWLDLPCPKSTVASGTSEVKSEKHAAEETEPVRRAARPRDYYVLEDITGSRFWVFREGLYHRGEDGDERSPQWFMHGMFA